MVVDTVVGDTAYSGKDNIILANDKDNGFELVARLNPTISNGTRKEEDRFDYNKDAGMFVCPAGHMAIRKARQEKNQTLVFFFDIERCRTCSRQNGRYKEGAKNAELKNVFGYDRADSYGLDCMRMQGAMVIFAANIKRILRMS